MTNKNNEQHELPELQVPDRFGVFLRWPENGTDWIHPDDVERVRGLIPSRRIFQRHVENQEYSRLTYGEFTIRIRPVLWLEVGTDGYLVGDRVEIRSRMGKHRPKIATIVEMLWNQKRKSVEYRLAVNEQLQDEAFFVADFQPAFRLDQPMSARQSELAAKSRVQ